MNLSSISLNHLGHYRVNFEGKHVVVYAADATVLNVTLFRLELIGINAQGATSDAEMTQALEVAVPDAILIDIDLDEGDGLYWIEKVAADQHTSHVPVMCMSSRGDLPLAESAFKAGARGFLIIPFDPSLLERKLLGLFQQPSSQRQHSAIV